MSTLTLPNAVSHTDYLTGEELSHSELLGLFAAAKVLKANPAEYATTLAGRSLVMLFEKPSLRTRVSFEIGMARLGGHAVYLDQQSCRIGEREPIHDFGKNLERWTDIVVARVFSHETIQQLAVACDVPVINALCDRYHPCQALADMLTLSEHFPEQDWSAMRLAYVGDGNNVCHSLLLAAAKLGMHMTAITPPGYEPDEAIVQDAHEAAAHSGGSVGVTNSLDAAADHHAVYTDTWVSMGDEAEAHKRHVAFEKYRITGDVMNAAAPEAIFMHCLPAHRGHEVDAEVIDSPRSVVYDQAENRMHAQNALLLHHLDKGSGIRQ